MSRILIVDDDEDSVELLKQHLGNEGHTFQAAPDGEAALHRSRAWKPDLVILDASLKDRPAAELISKLRGTRGEEYVSIILLTGEGGGEEFTKSLGAGADDCLAKPFRAQDLISRTRTMIRFKELQDNLKRTSHRVDELTMMDGVTGLFNLQTFVRKGEEEIFRSLRFKKPMSLLALNIDGFASVNEMGGFPFGNFVLKEVAARIQSCLRPGDLSGRLGSDEFLVLLPDTDLSAAETMAERIKQALKSSSVKQDRQTVQVTASIGIAGVNHQRGEPKMGDLLRYAVETLRQAKSNGSDQLEIYSFT